MYKEYTDSLPTNFYYGVSVNKSKSLGVAMSLAKKIKAAGWEYAKVEYDTEKQKIRLTKSTEGILVRWGYIRADLRDVMPQGRYIVTSESKNQYTFNYENTTP